MSATIRPDATHRDVRGLEPEGKPNDSPGQKQELAGSEAQRGVAFRQRARFRYVLAVAVALVAAVAIDWLLVPNSYPVAAAYGIALLLAAHMLAPKGVAITGSFAVILSLASNVMQRAPTLAAAADNAGLVAIGVLAYLLARQREVSEATRGRLELQHAAARALAEGATLQIASSTVLGAIARQLGWAQGALWCVDKDAEVLTCIATWRSPRTQLDSFDAQTQGTRFARGVGLPGRVWADGRAVWIADVQQATNFPRQAVAGKASLHAALAFPIRHGDELLGVIEFFSFSIQQPDEGLLALLDAVGAQVGLFLARRRAEDQVGVLLVREQSARELAEAAVRLRDSFLASVSHDLRSPLGAIRGYAQLAKRRARDLAEPFRQELTPPLDNVDAAVKRMITALDDLLDLAQLQAGQRLMLRRGPADLVSLTRHAVADQQVTSSGPHIEMTAEVPDLIGSWDAARLERVLANLLSNAIKYSPEGGDIEVMLARRRIDGQDWAVLQVEDHGIGIPVADLGHVFEPFWRAANALTASAGTGLGLAGSREVVEQHGGRISVQSREGYGSIFTVELPLDADKPVDA